jgi:hypothetical protein
MGWKVGSTTRHSQPTSSLRPQPPRTRQEKFPRGEASVESYGFSSASYL